MSKSTMSKRPSGSGPSSLQLMPGFGMTGYKILGRQLVLIDDCTQGPFEKKRRFGWP